MYKVDIKDIEHLNYRKTQPDLVDMYGNSIQGEYYQGVEAAYQYAYDIMTDNIVSGYHCKNTIKRFLSDLNRDDLELDHDMVDVVIAFANSLNHVKGPISGQPIMLMRWMIFILLNIFGFYYTKGEAKGERRFQKAFVMVARGNAKSFLCSIIALLMIVLNQNGKPYSCSAARTRQQARIVLDDAMSMLRKADSSIKAMFKLYANHIECPATEGKMESVSSDAQSLDGKRISGAAIVDELHAHTDSEVYNVLKTGMQASKDPLLFSITTAGKDMDSFCYQLMEHLREVNLDISKDDRYFGIEYSIDEDDDYEDDKNWEKANPALGHAVNKQGLKSELAEAKMSPSQRNDFITKHCNRFVQSAENGFIDGLELEKCADEISLEDYEGQRCYLGLDLAQRTDLCSLSYVFYDEDEEEFAVFTKNYLPRGVLKRVKPSIAEKYLNWEEQGSLTFTEGESTDFEIIMDDIREAWSMFDVKACAFDPANATQLANKMLAENILMVDVRQGYGLSEPARLFQSIVLDQKLKYSEDDKVFHWCCVNATYTEGKMQAIQVHKNTKKQEAKVDAIIATLTAMKLIVLDINETSVYETKDILEL